MSIRARVDDAMILKDANRHEGALLSLLVAVAATSRRRYPKGTKSLETPDKSMGDREAFERFFGDEMLRVSRMLKCDVKYRGELLPLERILYKWLRCELMHNGTLPCDIHFRPDDKSGGMGIRVKSQSLELTHGWLGALANAVMGVKENVDQFG